jgi:outer membrane protein assembly factor BamB
MPRRRLSWKESGFFFSSFSESHTSSASFVKGIAMRAASIFLCGLGLFLAAAEARAENIADLLVSQSVVERHGLTRAWFAQLPLAGVRSKIVAVVPDDDLLLISTTTGDVHAVDSETGRLVWSAQVGDPRQPTLRPAGNGQPEYRKAHWKPEGTPKPTATATTAGPAAANAASPAATTPAAVSPVEIATPAKANNLVVAVINGMTLYLLDRADGRQHIDAKSKQVWQVELRNLPKNGAMVTDELVYVPTANGHIETYAINDLKAGVTYVTSSGRNELPPVVSGLRVAWISDRGTLHITMPDGITPKWEVDLSGPASAQVAVHAPYVFAANSDGYLFCIRETEGAVLWKFATGTPIRHAPVAIRDVVYVLPEDAGVYCVAAADGRKEWVNANPRQFLAASPTKVYTVDRWNRMLVLDGKAGGTLDSIPLPTDVHPLTNPQTDRILLSSDSGMLQCLHETLMYEPAYYLTPKIALPPKPIPPVVNRPKPSSDEEKPKPVPVKKPKPDPDAAPPAVKPAKKAKAPAN